MWLASDSNDLQSLFLGFFNISTLSNYMAISLRSIRNLSNPLIYPSQWTNTIDVFLTQKVTEWIWRNMATEVNVSDYYFSNQTCLATFLPDTGFSLPRPNRPIQNITITNKGFQTIFVLFFTLVLLFHIAIFVWKM